MALAHAHLIDAHTTHVAEIRLGIGRVHLPEEHPPQPGVGLPTASATLLMGISRISSSAKASNSLVKCVLKPSHGGRTRKTWPHWRHLPRGKRQVISQRCWKTFRCRHVSTSVWS